VELLNVRLLPAEAVLAGRATTTGEEVAVLRGDLSVEPLPVVLVQLAAGAATGCLHLQDLAGAPAAVYLRSGCVYSVSAPGRQPQLSTRLLTSGATGSAELVEAFVAEQVLASVSGLLTWTAGSWRFRVNERTHDDVARPVPVVGLLAEVGRRGAVWAGLAPVVHGAAAVVALSAAGGSADELAIDADAWSLLCRVDGARTLGELAHDCGLTLYEAGQIAHALVVAGLVTIAAPSRPGQVDEDAAVVGAPDALAAAVRLALSLAAPPPLSDRSGPMPVQDQDQDPCLDDGTNGGTGDLHDVDSSISRVSQAPSALLGPTPPPKRVRRARGRAGPAVGRGGTGRRAPRGRPEPAGGGLRRARRVRQSRGRWHARRSADGRCSIARHGTVRRAGLRTGAGGVRARRGRHRHRHRGATAGAVLARPGRRPGSGGVGADPAPTDRDDRSPEEAQGPVRTDLMDPAAVAGPLNPRRR